MFNSQYRLAKAHQERLLADAQRMFVGIDNTATMKKINTIDRFLLNVSDLLIAAGEGIQCSIKQKERESVQTSAQ